MVTFIGDAMSFGAGLASWTFLEYGLHRFVGHEGMLDEQGHAMHLHHHQNPQTRMEKAEEDGYGFIDGLIQMAPLAMRVLTPINAAMIPVIGFRRSAFATLGMVTGWVLYEKLHHDIHTRAPENAYERWAWKHHLAHHFKNPKNNHGVTSPVWDMVYGTHQPVEEVAVPAKFMPPWLEEGDLPGIKLKGRPKPAENAPAAKKKKAGNKAA